MYFHYFLLPPLEKGQGLSFEQTWISFIQECFVPSLVEIGLVVLEEFFFYFVNEFPIFHYYFPLENGQVLHLKKLESCWPKHALCQVWLKLAPWFWRKRFLKISLKYSHYFIIISPLKRWGHSFNETWIPFTQECFVL